MVLFFSSAQLALSQQNRPRPGDADGAAACATCCGGTVLMIVIPILLGVITLAVNIAILFWVAKDAKSRGMDGAMWIFLILFTSVLGLAIYLFSRPQGVLVQCEHCGNNRLEMAAKCPHCQNRTSASPRRSKRRRYGEDDDDEDD
jgi:hypothetical protein